MIPSGIRIISVKVIVVALRISVKGKKDKRYEHGYKYFWRLKKKILMTSSQFNQ